MGVDGRGDDDVPWVFNRVVAMPEHKPEPEFSAIAETEVADDNQRSVNIAVNAVDITHPWPISCLYAGQTVYLKTDPSLGMLADSRIGR